MFKGLNVEKYKTNISYIVLINLLVILIAIAISILIENRSERYSELATRFLSSKLVYPVLIGDRELIKQTIDSFSFPVPISKLSVEAISDEVLYKNETDAKGWHGSYYNIQNKPIDVDPVGKLFVSYSINLKPHVLNIVLTLFFLFALNMLIRKYLNVKYRALEYKENQAIQVINHFINRNYTANQGFNFDDDTLLRSLHRLSLSLTNLEKENTEKKYFIASMSHEIRNPLNAIIAMLRLALDNASDAKKVREYLGDASEAANLLTKVISDVIDIAKIESGSLDISAEPFSLLELLDSAVSIVEPSSSVELSVDAEDCRPFYIGDSLRIKQALVNILHNSVKHTTKGYISLSVSSKLANDNVYNVSFRIKDTGAGIDETNLEHIFDPFVSHGKGMGLGLYITKTLVESMGGSIDCHSTQGFGMETVIKIPLESIGESAYLNSFHKDVPGYTEHTLKGVNVLVVEDNEINRKAIYHLTRSWGMHCTAVSNGNEALELENRHFDLILMDLNMPGVSGIEVATSLRHKGISTPIIAVTGNVLKGESKRVKDAGFNGFIGKPFQPSTLQKECLKVLNPDSIQEEKEVLNNLDFPGLSLGEAQELYGNDDDTLLSDLLYFRHTYSNVTETFEKYLDDQAVGEVIRLAHDLKTDSANIGAGEIQAIAVLLDDEALDLDVAITLVSTMKRKLPVVINSITTAITHLKDESLN